MGEESSEQSGVIGFGVRFATMNCLNVKVKNF
jgi:hypothetical protein